MYMYLIEFGYEGNNQIIVVKRKHTYRLEQIQVLLDFKTDRCEDNTTP